MSFRKQLLTMITMILCLCMAGEVMADISNAAVLFLRIAAGARAAGMGEAFVAVADDGTTVHWNPAGLGSYPLADTWIESGIPEAYRPIKGFAAMSTGGSSNYLDYDIWAITPVGLIRYDNKRWHTDETFSTRTDETVVQKVKSYFGTVDDARLEVMIDRVAELNNRGSLDDLTSLRDSVLAAVPADYDELEAVTRDLDSLVASYRQCRVNWDRVRELRGRLKDGLKEDGLSNTECDRISVALERSQNRFLPEELRLPYSALFSTEPTAVASTGEVLLVGASDGLARYNGTNWQMVTTKDGTPLTGITGLHDIGGQILVATKSGITRFDGRQARSLTTEKGSLPAGEIQAIGGSHLTDLYAVVDGSLYRYNGRRWSSSVSHTVVVGDSMERLAAAYSIYDTEADKQRFADEYRVIQEVVAAAKLAAAQTDTAPETATDDSSLVGNLLATNANKTVVDDSTVTETVVDDSTVVEAALATEIEEKLAPVDAQPSEIPGIDTPLVPGENIRLPLVASIKGRVHAIHVGARGQIWLGTSLGVYYFDGDKWLAPGYASHVVVEGETIQSLAARRSGLSEAEAGAYGSILDDINDLDGAQPEVGTSVLLYSNPAARAVNKIATDGDLIYFATERGLLEFDGSASSPWSRSSLRGLSRANIVGINTLGSESWIASDSKLVIKGRGHSEIVLMHAKWLPELADDLYYGYLSAVSSKEGWGTFGGSITFMSFGSFVRTNETGAIIGDFSSYDLAMTVSYGTSLTRKLKGGITFKLIHSSLADQGAGAEKGSGRATGFALDVGGLYHVNSRLTLGLTVSNLGPQLSYIDAAQSDPLPRNLAFGFAYKLMQSDYVGLMVTAEINKLLVGLDDRSSEELRQSVINGGAEFTYADMIAARVGYIYDQEGQIKTPTLGFGLSPIDMAWFDFAYIPSNKDLSLANTLRISIRLII